MENVITSCDTFIWGVVSFLILYFCLGIKNKSGKYILAEFIAIFIILISLVGFCKIFLGKSTLSTSMDDWGAYATCLSSIVSFVTIYWVYKTYNSQIKMSKQTTFDQLFTQLLANHYVIYQKAVEEKKRDSYIFEEMKNSILNFNNIDDLKVEYNNFLMNIPHSSGVNLRNYFKYVYYEISTVEKAYIDDDTKKDCIKLIQSQMNHDELICYLINQIQHTSDETHNKHIRDLQKYNFFEDIIAYSNKYNDKDNKIQKLLNEFKYKATSSKFH